jgi:hypothetical protein
MAPAGGEWGIFAALFLIPDLSMLGYLVGPRRGAVIYNLVHIYVAPALLALIGGIGGSGLALKLAEV